MCGSAQPLRIRSVPRAAAPLAIIPDGRRFILKIEAQHVLCLLRRLHWLWNNGRHARPASRSPWRRSGHAPLPHAHAFQFSGDTHMRGAPLRKRRTESADLAAFFGGGVTIYVTRMAGMQGAAREASNGLSVSAP